MQYQYIINTIFTILSHKTAPAQYEDKDILATKKKMKSYNYCDSWSRLDILIYHRYAPTHLHTVNNCKNN